MGARRRQHERIAADHLALQRAAQVGLEREQRGVEAAGVEIAGEIFGLVFPPAHGQAGMRALDRGRGGGQQVGRYGRDDADGERARQRIAEPPGGVDQIVGVDQHAPGAFDQVLARRREQHAPAIALEQADAERALELRELRAQRRLRDTALLGGAPEAARVGDRDRVLELPQGGRVGGEGHDSP